MTEVVLKKAAQPFSDTSFATNLNNGYYSAWSGKKTLETNGLIIITGKPAKYALSEEG
jgi:hypothetical protein